MSKRENYISWDEYFMGIAIMSAKRSKDPSTQVGCCIVNEEKRIMTVGYNGMRAGCDDDEYPWDRDGGMLDTKYAFVCHAELNAILNNRSGSLENCTAYVTLFPCNECAKAIIQSGIKKIVYLSDKYAGTESTIASKKMLDSAGVKYEEYSGEKNTIEINFK